MAKEETIITFDEVTYKYGHNKTILDEVSFGIRRGAKITLMGQNGAGKSTIFGLITGKLKPEEGEIHRSHKLSIATARQIIPRDEMDLTVREFFQKVFPQKVYDIDPRIDAVLDTVHLKAPYDRLVGSFSGGQQARLLLASALIQDPDLLLLDEPTNNLDKAGIEHLTDYIKKYEKTCVVISHDADFLNSFTEGVLYLDVRTHKVEQYTGNYFDVLEQVAARVEKEQMKNAQFAKKIQSNKDKINFFAHKGGKMRLIAKKLKDEVEEMEDSKVDVRKEDKTISPFSIPMQENITGEIIRISSLSVIRDHIAHECEASIILKRNQHLLLSGPNGIGKSTLLESLVNKTAQGAHITPGIVVGYYRQDFSNLDFDKTVHETLVEVMKHQYEQDLRATAARFLLRDEIIHTKVGALSEGQKGLVAFARIVLLKPGLLILDEPTNHINFRHIPVIAQALDEYEGAMILVSHVPSFVSQIRIDEKLDLEKLAGAIKGKGKKK